MSEPKFSNFEYNLVKQFPSLYDVRRPYITNGTTLEVEGISIERGHFFGKLVFFMVKSYAKKKYDIVEMTKFVSLSLPGCRRV